MGDLLLCCPTISVEKMGATYQCAMTLIFHNFIHKILEDYVDDILLKSLAWGMHVENLRLVFERLQLYKMRLNHLKCIFDVDAEKLLGFIISCQGIEIDTNKIDAIVNMPPPRNISQLHSLQGKIKAIRWFVTQLANQTLPFTRLLKKDVHFKWNEYCQKAFESIKDYLANPPILMSAMSDRPFFLYISVTSHALVVFLARRDEEGLERSFYYVSQTLIDYETWYSAIEKQYLALVFVT